MLSVYLGFLGLGASILGLGLLVQGPLALDRRWTRERSDSAYANQSGSIDLHADRSLGQLEGAKDELWRPVATVHFWTLAAATFGATGLAGLAAGWTNGLQVGAAVIAALGVGYAGARVLRALPPRSGE